MKHLHKFNESLHVSESVYSVLQYLMDEYEDKIADLLNTLIYNDKLYADDEDVNYLELSKQLKMLNFRPTNKRGDTALENYKEEKSTSMKIGRLVNSIIRTVDKFFNVTFEAEAVLFKLDRSWARNRAYLLVKGHVDFLQHTLSDEKAKINFTVDDKKYKAKLHPIQPEQSKVLPGIFGESAVDVTEFYLEDEEGLPISFTTSSGIQQQKCEPKLFQIELKSNYDITDRDIEKFVDRAVAYIKLTRSDEESEMKIVEGEKIRHWYLDESYQVTQGELGNSCMSHEECQDFLDIYCENKGIVSLLILVNKKNKLIGRALVWLLRDGRKFMDRAYTILPSDKYVFYNYAKENNWAYRMNELGEVSFRHGTEKKPLHEEKIEVDLEYCHFDLYPYLDTLNILNLDLARLTNYIPKVNNTLLKLTDTEGGSREI